MTTDAEKSRSRSKPWRKALPVWAQLVILLAVFAAGIGVGAVTASRYVLTRMQYYRAHPEALPSEITGTLASRLVLNNEQSERVLKIITHRHGRIEAVRQASAPQIHSEFDLMVQEINDVLEDHQQPRWLETAEWVRESFLPLNSQNTE